VEARLDNQDRRGSPPIEATLFFRRNRLVGMTTAWPGPTPDWEYGASQAGGPASVFFNAKSPGQSDAESLVAWVLKFLAANEVGLKTAIDNGWDPFLTFVVQADEVEPLQSISLPSGGDARELGNWGVSLAVYFE
jgi:hypothetical protein